MEELYLDFFERIEIRNWENILKSDIFMDIQIKTALRPAMLYFFAEHPVLPKDVWVLFDREFGWTENRSSMPAESIPYFAVLKAELDPRWDLDYACFQGNNDPVSANDCDTPVWNRAYLKIESEYQAAFPEYAILRRDFRHTMYMENDSHLADIYESAILLFPDDPDLHRMYYEYLKINEDVQTFDQLFDIPDITIQKLREFYPENHEYEVAEADYYFRVRNYKKAVILYTSLAARFPDLLDIAFHYGMAVRYTGNYEKSLLIFSGIRERYADAQGRLNSGQSVLKDKLAIQNQIARNAFVLNQLNSTSGEEKITLTNFQTKIFYALLITAASIIVFCILSNYMSH